MAKTIFLSAAEGRKWAQYVTLMKQGAFVAQIVIEYKERHVDAQGNSLTSTDQYIYQKTSAHMAVYEISGTTLNDELVRVSFG